MAKGSPEAELPNGYGDQSRAALCVHIMIFMYRNNNGTIPIVHFLTPDLANTIFPLLSFQTDH